MVRARAGVAAAVLLTLLITLTPSADRGGSAFAWCLVCGDQGAADAIANVALFAPLGAALAVAGFLAIRAVPAAALLAATIELVQLTVAGRYATAGDVAWNALGAAVGFAAVRSGAWRPALEHRAAPVATAAAAVLVLTATAWLLQPVAAPAPLFGSWTPLKQSFEQYGGRVLAASLGGMPLPSVMLTDPGRVNATLHAGARLDVTFVAGPAPRSRAYLFGVSDANLRDVVRLQPEGADLVVGLHTRAKAFRLAQPTLRFPGLFAGVAPGDTVRLAWWRAPGRWCATTGAGERCARWNRGRGWALLLGGTRLAGAQLIAADAAWTVALFVPLGLAVAVGRRRRIASGRAQPL